MQYLLHTANLATPTVESFREYLYQRLESLNKLLRGEARVNISVSKIGSKYTQFELKVELITDGRVYFAHTTEKTITEAVDKVNKQLRRQITRGK